MKNITYISAGAGSGKTYTLTTKLAELIKDGTVAPEQVILTTFTKKAANEFKEKAKAELYKIGKYDEASRLDNALMGTIDSVATNLIQKYWYAIGISPKQGVMDDSAKASYINQSIANIPSDEDLHFFAEFRKTFGIVDSDSKPDDNFWKNHLKDIVEKSISFDITDYEQSVNESLAILKHLRNGSLIHLDNTGRTKVLDALKSEIDQCNPDANNTIATLEGYNSLLRRYRYQSDIEFLQDFAAIIKGAPASIRRSTDTAIVDANQRSNDLWQSQEVYDLQKQYITTIFRLAKEWNVQYTDYKLNKRIMDFSDIEHYMHKLLEDKEVAEEIGKTYTHLFVDEFQDCSPIQVKIFMALADVVKQSYWVGDTKQAIYGFRGSDTALTKAVADTIYQKEGSDGCKAETLKESWRSVPGLVNASNNAFKVIFKPIFDDKTEEQVPLKSAMALQPEKFDIKLEDRAKNPLRYLHITDKRSPRSSKLKVDDVAMYIKNVIEKENVNPSDIAVLGRTGYSLDNVQSALNGLGIETDRETTLNKESKACQLMMALTSLTVNPYDDLAKATIAYLTQDDMHLGKIIDSKLEYNNKTPEKDRKPWLSETMMISRINAIRDRVKYQGIGALMETLVVELDVKNVMERWAIPVEESMSEVKALISAAKQYEDRSSELAQPATPSGFAKFMEENEFKIPVSGNGVQLLTMHSAKGLEWKYVFLLMDETLDAMDLLKNDLYGIHHFHPELPTADNPYPQMSIRLMPWIFGSRSSNVPQSLTNIIFESKFYERLKRQCIDENARLLYVGFTRASEVLVLVPWFVNKEFDWFKRSGLVAAGTIEDGDVLGIDVTFDIVKAQYPIPEEDTDGDKPASVAHHCLKYHSDAPSEAGMRAIAPSGVKGTAEKVAVVYRSEKYITLNSGELHGRSYSEVGDCIHNVYASIESLDKSKIEQAIKSHEMNDVLPNADDVIRAWDNLQEFLKKEYGDPIASYHERPFRMLKEDGSLVVGSIDYVYETSAGSILIDYKTFPQVQKVTDPTDTHYAGNYAGQLDAYQSALEAAGEKVIKRFIYYPVSGMLVEVGISKS